MCTQICVETLQCYKRELADTAISSQKAMSMVPEYIHNCDSFVVIHVEMIDRFIRKEASISKHASLRAGGIRLNLPWLGNLTAPAEPKALRVKHK